MSTLIIGQSGGPTSVINASLVGMVKEALKQNEISKILGAKYGLGGIINEDFVIFNEDSPLEEIKYTPSSALGSIRFHIEKYPLDKDIYDKILTVFKKYDVRYFAYIGGNDSMDTCSKISYFFQKIKYDCKVIGVPKTIDNDLTNTLYSPGYPSSAKYIASTIEEIYYDTNAYKDGRATIVEIMGRDAGWLTASSKIASLNDAGPDLIYLPESPFDINQFLQDVKKIYDKKHKVLIAVSEGIKDNDGNYFLIHRDFKTNDDFGHLQLGGVALVLAEIIKKNLNIPVRAIELNLPQRCSMHLVSKTDLKDSENVGKYAVRYMLKGISGQMITITNDKPKYKYTPLDDVAGKTKLFPLEWIKNNNDIDDKYLDYILPLIKGEVNLKYENGIPQFKKL